MATLYVKTPNGTQYSIDLTKINSGGGSAAANGYALLPNGCFIQWGKYTPSAAGSNITVTFTTSFSTACYVVVWSFGGSAMSTAGAFAYWQATSITKSNFVIGYDTTTPIYWMAIGQ